MNVLHCIIVTRRGPDDYRSIGIPLYALTWLRDVAELRRELRGVQAIYVRLDIITGQPEWDWRRAQRSASHAIPTSATAPAPMRSHGGPRNAA